jgi:transposase
MDVDPAALPDDLDALKAAVIAARAEVARAQAEVAAAQAELSSNQALIVHLKLQIDKLNRDRFGPRSERTARLLAQMELQLEELEASATEDELAAEAAAAKISNVAGFKRKHPARRPFPPICRASVSSLLALPHVHVAAVIVFLSLARTSPKVSNQSHAVGR